MTRDETPRDPLREALSKAYDYLGADSHDKPGDMDIVAAKATLRAALASSTPDAPWPSLADFRRMSPPEVNAFLASRGATIRVRDDSSTQDALDVEALGQALWQACSHDGVMHIDADGWKELNDIATDTATEYAAIRAARGQQ